MNETVNATERWVRELLKPLTAIKRFKTNKKQYHVLRSQMLTMMKSGSVAVLQQKPLRRKLWQLFLASFLGGGGGGERKYCFPCLKCFYFEIRAVSTSFNSPSEIMENDLCGVFVLKDEKQNFFSEAVKHQQHTDWV